MNRRVIVLLGILAILVLVTGCAPRVTKIRVGKLVTESESVELGGAKSVRTEIRMGAGELSVSGGAHELLEAGFTYNVDELKPEVKYSGGTLIVQHPDVKFEGLGSLWDIDDYRCEWDLRLNDDVDMEKMSVKVGAGEADLELGSLSLTTLDVNTGAGNVTVDVSGATSLTRLDVQMGVGNLTVDLTGKWERDVDVDLKGGVGELVLWLPRDAGVSVDVEGGLGKINASGLKKEGDEYVNDAYGESGATLRIDIAGGVGEVNLEVRE